MIETLGLTAERCIELLDGGEVSCRELAEAYLARIERFFARITEDRIRRGVFTSVPQLERAIAEGPH